MLEKNNELEILKILLDLEKKIETLEINIKIPINEEDEKKSKIELENTLKEIEKCKTILTEIENKSFSYKAKDSLDILINEYLIEIKKENKGYRLSTSQGFKDNKYELFKIIENELNQIINGDNRSSNCKLLKYNINKEDSIEINDFEIFLEEEIQLLRIIEAPNFMKLRNYRDKFMARMVKEFIK